MCSGTVVYPWRWKLRAWEATRLPRWKISTVVAVKRASSGSPRRVYGTE